MRSENLTAQQILFRRPEIQILIRLGFTHSATILIQDEIDEQDHGNGTAHSDQAIQNATIQVAKEF